jgi:hypothetical protein
VLSLLLAGVDVPAPAAYEAEMATLAELTGERHRLVGQAVDLDGYSTSGLASKVMGRGPQDDPIFFAAALASGTALARAARRDAPGEAQNELR